MREKLYEFHEEKRIKKKENKEKNVSIVEEMSWNNVSAQCSKLEYEKGNLQDAFHI